MIEEIKRLICHTVLDAPKKLTPGEITLSVARQCGADRKTVRLAIKDLVGRGELTYSYVYGTSYLGRSFDRPVRISRRIVIKPPDKICRPKEGDVVIDIARGAAFGDGAHPTTSLALRAIDVVLADHLCLRAKSLLAGLDVGTGSGILAIALVKLGVEKVVGIDLDPCSLSEATHNVLLNGCGSRVMITNTPLERLAGCFSVIVANLAYPTLRKLAPLLSGKMEKDGVLIVSGFKEPASKGLSAAYAEQGLRLIWEEADREWICLVLRKHRNMVWG
jgi:ribosomal protein L11 methyltransferase